MATKSDPVFHYEIKPLCADDLDTVVAIDRSISGVTRRGYFEKRLEAATARPKDYVYVGLHGAGQLLGFAFAKLVDGEFGSPGASASLDAIGVTPDHQGEGVGHKLLTGITDVLASKGVGELTSQVDWVNRSLLCFLGENGFQLDARMVLNRSTEKLPIDYPAADEVDEPLEIDHSAAIGDDPAALAHDLVVVRSMTANDLRSMVSIDRKIFGEERAAYLERKQHEVLNASGIRVSLVAELEGFPVGFIMARVDFGEFGHTGKEAVMDTVGVDPDYQGHKVGQALMSQLLGNLSGLQVETVRTEVDWPNTGILAYLNAAGFAPAQQITLCRTL